MILYFSVCSYCWARDEDVLSSITDEYESVFAIRTKDLTQQEIEEGVVYEDIDLCNSCHTLVQDFLDNLALTALPKSRCCGATIIQDEEGNWICSNSRQLLQVDELEIYLAALNRQE